MFCRSGSCILVVFVGLYRPARLRGGPEAGVVREKCLSVGRGWGRGWDYSAFGGESRTGAPHSGRAIEQAWEASLGTKSSFHTIE